MCGEGACEEVRVVCVRVNMHDASVKSTWPCWPPRVGRVRGWKGAKRLVHSTRTRKPSKGTPAYVILHSTHENHHHHHQPPPNPVKNPSWAIAPCNR
jgi:hypothetical protein